MGSSSIFVHFDFISLAALTLSLEFLICVFGSSANALKPCDFPAIFNFGDSNSDTGGLPAAFNPPPPPYGETFFKRPSGRVSDGRLIIDFIAEGLGIPYLHAYLDAVAPNFSTGANFATSASTIVPLRDVLPLGGYSPFSLNVQCSQFIHFKNASIFNQLGGFFKELLPKEEYYSHALYTIDIGQNDIGAGLSESKSIGEIRASIPMIVNNFSANVKSLYEEGGRSFWIHNTGPIGCLPYTFVPFPVGSSQIDSAGCAIPYNDLSQYFNKKLKEAVVQLRKDLPLAAITYVDMYTIKYTLISQASKFGIECQANQASAMSEECTVLEQRKTSFVVSLALSKFSLLMRRSGFLDQRQTSVLSKSAVANPRLLYKTGLVDWRFGTLFSLSLVD